MLQNKITLNTLIALFHCIFTTTLSDRLYYGILLGDEKKRLRGIGNFFKAIQLTGGGVRMDPKSSRPVLGAPYVYARTLSDVDSCH